MLVLRVLRDFEGDAGREGDNNRRVEYGRDAKWCVLNTKVRYREQTR